jgi:hypothetical protein|tara:strand:- start:642 stop:839 length:198 start_codon:yes stop_codon:yes gene_type:complete
MKGESVMSMDEAIRQTWRHRVSVSQTSTGKNSFDCSVEATGASMEDVLRESDELVHRLRARYPIE